MVSALAMSLIVSTPHIAHAESVGNRTGVSTGLPLPRFVSLKSARVNVRVGPSRSHQVLWVFQRRGLPVEVIAEFEHWRRIRDADGDIGWVYYSLLAGDRTALVQPGGSEDGAPLRAAPDANAPVSAVARAGVIGELEQCLQSWCLMRSGAYQGWVAKPNLWGVYSRETFGE